MGSDPWLLVTGFVAALTLLLSPRLRPFAVALLIQVVVLVKGGYLPFFYVTGMLPFAALGWLCLGVIAASALRARRPASLEALGRVSVPADNDL